MNALIKIDRIKYLDKINQILEIINDEIIIRFENLYELKGRKIGDRIGFLNLRKVKSLENFHKFLERYKKESELRLSDPLLYYLTIVQPNLVKWLDLLELNQNSKGIYVNPQELTKLDSEITLLNSVLTKEITKGNENQNDS